MRLSVLCRIALGLAGAVIATPARSESPPLLDISDPARGISFLAALPRTDSNHDPPNGSPYQALSLGRHGIGLHSAYRVEPRPLSQAEQKQEWAKSRPTIGVAFHKGSWTLAAEYLRRGRTPLIDRGRFGSGKFFIGAKYQWSEDFSAYFGASRGISAGLRWQIADDQEAALTFVSQSPHREIRELFDLRSSERNVVTLTYGLKF